MAGNVAKSFRSVRIGYVGGEVNQRWSGWPDGHKPC